VIELGGGVRCDRVGGGVSCAEIVQVWKKLMLNGVDYDYRVR